MPCIQSSNALCQVTCLEACGVDHRARLQARAIGRRHLDAAAADRHLLNATVTDHQPTCMFQITLQRQHQSMAVNDARRRRVHGTQAFQLRFEFTRLLAVDQAQIGYPVDTRPLQNRG